MTPSSMPVPEEAPGMQVPWYWFPIVGFAYICFCVILLHLPAERLLNLMMLGSKWRLKEPGMREEYLRRVIWVRVILVGALVGSIIATIAGLLRMQID